MPTRRSWESSVAANVYRSHGAYLRHALESVSIPATRITTAKSLSPFPANQTELACHF